MPDDFHDAWVAALDDLEIGVAQAEAVLAAAHTAPYEPVSVVRVWYPPQGIGPIPASLHERAARVAAQQHDVTARLDVAVRSARKGSRVLDKIASASHLEPTPLYLDVDG